MGEFREYFERGLRLAELMLILTTELYSNFKDTLVHKRSEVKCLWRWIFTFNKEASFL